MAEGGGIEPLTLLRCHPGIRSRLPDRSSGTFRCRMAEGVGIEPTGGLEATYGLANRCITTLPTFHGITRKIDLIENWRTVWGSNPSGLFEGQLASPEAERFRCSLVVGQSIS